MSNVIELRGLTKTFGDFRALDGVDLDVPEGSVFGFLGPNGAGKTTTLRILTGLANQTAGTATIFGHDTQTEGRLARADMGFLPDVPGYYSWMTAGEFLRFSGRLFGLSDGPLAARVESLLDLAGLTDVDTKVGGFSRGMKQRLGVAQALINAPRLLMLDEPTSALDPMGRKDVLEMIGALKGKTTVFFSTHILNDVERVCDNIAVLDRGRVVRQAPIGELKSEGVGCRIAVEVTADTEGFVGALNGEEWASECTVDGARIHCLVSDLDVARLRVPALVAERGVGLVRMADEERTLEDVFVGLVGGEQ